MLFFTPRRAAFPGILCIALLAVSGSQAGNDTNTGTEFAVYGSSFSNTGQDAPHRLGLELGFSRRFDRPLVPELRIGARKFRDSGDDGFMAPVYVGLRVDLQRHSRLIISPFAGFGPVAILGNDWGQIFATFDSGIRVSTPLTPSIRFTLGAGYGRDMLFHPSEYEWVSAFGGFSVML